MEAFMIRIRTLMTLALLFALPALAQDPRMPGGDPIGEQVFPPELILQHQKAIGITDAQRTALVAEVKRVQGSLLDQQVELQRRVEKLVELMTPDRPDETQVLAQLDLVLAAEREVKRQHLSLVVRLKSLLTPDQIRTLRSLRSGPATAR
jgi:Spy/CpxP family protein refolding chaperone